MVKASEVPGSTPALTTWICSVVAQFLKPRPCFVNSQLGFLTNVMFSLNSLFSDSFQNPLNYPYYLHS